MARALYRQYRPKTFDEVLGQDRVVNVLKNQVKSDKISHAYLFAGERGTGKTTSAKIFAKAINCLNPKDGSPCQECENCKAIENETTIDVVEMDAASNRRIDDIRNLKDNVIYPPNNLKYKVYIIDEAHMITREAFNALLKIMEEPPSHLVFILATTEIDKIPKTILSRVQKFEFNKIDENKIRSQIDIILEDKSVEIEKEAVDLIIKKAGGAMRDALSILDQVLSFEKSAYSLSEVETILGVVDFYDVDKLTQAIIGKSKADALHIIYSLRANNKTNKDILDALINYFNDIMIYSITQNDKFFDNEERLSFIKNLAESIDDIEISDYLDILIKYSNQLKLTDNTDVLTEICIMRLIDLVNNKNIDSRIRKLEASHGDDLIDQINKAIDYRLKNVDLNSISSKDEKKEAMALEEANTPNMPIEINNPPAESNVETEDVKEQEEPMPLAKDDEPISQTRKNSLTLEEEKQIKEMMIEKAGGVLNALFSSEGFNYQIVDNDFKIYIKEDFYSIFIITKIDEINESLNQILGTTYNLSVESGEDLGNNNSTTNYQTEETTTPTDNTNRLREVFGDELIIE